VIFLTWNMSVEAASAAAAATADCVVVDDDDEADAVFVSVAEVLASTAANSRLTNGPSSRESWMRM